MYSVVITSAGSGTRSGLGYNKMLYEYQGITIIERITALFCSCPEFDDVIVTVSSDDYSIFTSILKNYNVRLVVGGQTRMDSVANGINQAKNPFIFVHDGARVFLDTKLISRLTAYEEAYDGLALAINAIDTTLKVEAGQIIEILERDKLFNMQTPQVVNKDIYIDCYNQAKRSNTVYTDEMSMLTAYGYNCRIVVSESYNKKLTRPEDFQED